MAQAWREHIEALKRFNRWEADQLPSRPSDYSRALAWLSEAWELAEKYGPPRDPAHAREEHFQELMHLRMALGRARLTP